MLSANLCNTQHGLPSHPLHQPPTTYPYDSKAKHAVSRYRNQAWKPLKKELAKGEKWSTSTNNGRMGWDNQIHTSRLPPVMKNHMYTRLHQAQCQLCLTTSLLATDCITHEGPRFFTLVQLWRTSNFFVRSDKGTGNCWSERWTHFCSRH